jgi:proteic killer suppression protein
MIKNFRHKGLKGFYEKGRTQGINPQWLKRIRAILARLDAARSPDDMDMPGLDLHPLKGDLKGHWAVDVTGNWRITFRFEGEDAHDIDLTDYH